MTAWGSRDPSAAIRQRSLPTWESLVSDQYARIYNLHLRLVHDSEVAADLTQDTFEQAWRSAASFQGRSRPETWLYGVALNVNRHFRTRAGMKDPPEEDLEGLLDPDPTAEELAILRQRNDLVCGAVARLPEALKRVVVLRYYMGVSCAEIARSDGEPEGTVRWRLHQATKKLWVMLQPTLGKELGSDEAGADGTLGYIA